ncbi:MAG: glycosyltransferase family 4 protein [Muribaculaceae bacterium]|nr:glycosyltransferase family 4 protein [Muribaculaceae bacterium]
MNIAYFINSLSNAAGMERIFIDKANLLSEREGMNVTLVSLMSSDDEQPAFKVSPRVKFIHLNLVFVPGDTSPRKRPFTFLWKWLKWRREVHRAVADVIRQNNIDIAISSTYDASLPLNAIDCHLIVESHAYRRDAVQGSALPTLRRYLMSRRVAASDALVALTHADASLWNEARRVEVIGNFTTIRPVAPYRPDTKRIMAAGRIDSQKGFDILVDAWRIVARLHPDWSLDIYGSATHNTDCTHADLQSRINEGGMSHCVTLCGTCHDMPRAYAEHSAFVLSSRYEGFGLVLLEAMACGVPCVTFDCPYGPSDIVGDGDDGIVVPFAGMTDRQRAEKLAQGLCSMIEAGDSGRMRMSEAAIKNAARFSPDATIDKWVCLFNDIMRQ